MIKRFEKFIYDNDLCSTNDNILVALSGGMDSVVLLHLFMQAGYSVAAAHCNFKLRGKESDDDERFVRNLCKKLNVRLFVNSCPADNYGLTIQEAARKLRYDFFEQIAQKQNFDKIAIAHHADDDVETFFINLFRGSGITGLKGIPLKREKIIRPMMFAGREEIEQYALNNKIGWRDDSSNNSDKYLRNRIRHELLPLLNELAEGMQGIKKSLIYLKKDAAMLEALFRQEKTKFTEKYADIVYVKPEKLGQTLPFHKTAFYILKEYGFNISDVDDIIRAWENNATGKTFFSHSHILVIERKSLQIRPLISSVEDEKYFIKKDDKKIEKPFDADVTIMEKITLNNEKLKNPNAAFMDFDKLSFPLIIRKWHKGDRFKPYGMKGTKLLSDFFTDNKLSNFEKQDVWLVESDNQIVWVVGYRISDIVKITKNTRRIFSIFLK